MLKRKWICWVVLCVGVCGLMQPVWGDRAMALDLRTDSRVAPIGLELHHLRFSWRIENAGFQSAWQVQAAGREADLDAGRAGLWDSKWRNGGETTQIAYEGKPPASGQTVWWRVRFRDDQGCESDWSAPAHFEMGLLREDDWQQAAWIACRRSMDEPQRPPEDLMGPWMSASGNDAVKAFTVDVTLPDIPVVSAMAYWGTTGNGAKAIASVDGAIKRSAVERVAHPNRGYVDLSFQFKPGSSNRLRLDVGRKIRSVKACFGLRIVFADGSEQIVRSGEGWHAEAEPKKSSPVVIAGAYGQAPLGEARVFPRRQLAPVWLRTSVPVKSGLSGARLYVSALGHGDIAINGRPVTDEVLAPAQTDYEDHGLVVTHDVTRLLQEGDNALSVLLNPGWYDQVGGFGQIMSYGRPALKVLLRLDYIDGRTEYVTSNSSWQYKEGGLREASIFLGERMDFRLEHNEWKTPEAGTGWRAVQTLDAPTPRMIASDLPPVRRLREIHPVKQWKVGEKTWLFDAGENIAGWVRLALDEPDGTVVRIRYSEMAENERLMNVPLSHWWCHGMVQNDEIICDGQPRVYESRFNYKGFRYFEVSGLSQEPKAGELVVFQIGNDAPQTAEFESSDPLLNRLFENGIRSHYGNMVNSLLDCPTREKCLWGGDLHASWAVGFSTLDPVNFYRHQVREGFSPPMDPGGVPGNVMVGKRLTGRTSSFNWSVSPLFITWRLYQYCGDLDTARSVYDPMRRFLQFFDENANDGVPHLTALADHAPPSGIDREPPNNSLLSALNFFAASQRFAALARALGKEEDAAWAYDIAAKAHAAVMRSYRPKDHTFGNGTQDSLALAFGVFESVEEERQLATSLVGHYRKNGHQFDGGFMSYWIYPMLSRHGYGDDALQMMRNTECVGPARAITQYDATTFWEMYFPDRESQFARSLNHHAGNHPAAWLITDLAGIRLDESKPGGYHFILEPCVPAAEKLDWVNGSRHTPHGLVESSWCKEDDQVVWEFTVPPNCDAQLHPPSQAVLKVGGRNVDVVSGMTVGPGRYRMIWPTALSD